MEECVLYDRTCIDCGECDRCDLNPNERCTNCCRCIDDGEDYAHIPIDEIIVEPQEHEHDGGDRE